MFDSCVYHFINEWLAAALLETRCKAMKRRMDRHDVKGFTAKTYLGGWFTWPLLLLNLSFQLLTLLICDQHFLERDLAKGLVFSSGK